jgi:hypothetical protein
MNEREAFEAWAGQKGRLVKRHCEGYFYMATDAAWAAWQARAALASRQEPAPEPDPMAWSALACIECGGPVSWNCEACQIGQGPMIVAPSRQEPSPLTVPEGWRLVPVEATPEIIAVMRACENYETNLTMQEAWAEMLSATPEAPA